MKNQTQAVKFRYSFYFDQKKCQDKILKILPPLKSVSNLFQNQQLHISIVLPSR